MLSFWVNLAWISKAIYTVCVTIVLPCHWNIGILAQTMKCCWVFFLHYCHCRCQLNEAYCNNKGDMHWKIQDERVFFDKVWQSSSSYFFHSHISCVVAFTWCLLWFHFYACGVVLWDVVLQIRLVRVMLPPPLYWISLDSIFFSPICFRL